MTARQTTGGVMEDFAALQVNPVVILPTYNNAGTLAGVLTRVAAHQLPMFVVDDGCTDASGAVLERWVQEHPAARATVLHHRHNRGKGAALKSGFAAATKAGFTHAITIDTDGQHDPERIADLLAAARKCPIAYVLGVRNDRHPDYPARSRLGRRISNLLVRLECGLKAFDSQCGMRVYPLELVRTVPCRAGRFGYETEFIVRAAWAGCPVVQIPINTRYLPASERVSHFRPWADSARAVWMHLRLIARTVTPVPHRRYHPAGLRLKPRFALDDLLSWINPLRAWRELREGQIDRNELATALAVGVFVANLPIYPLQTVFALYLGRRLHLNPLAVMAGTQASIPPIGAVLIVAAICLGHLLMHGALPAWPDLHSVHAAWRTGGRPLLLDWIVGGVLIGLVMAAVTFALTHHFCREREESPVVDPADSIKDEEPAARSSRDA